MKETSTERLLGIMRKLRGPDGCPWDREQTLDSLKSNLIEETYEVIDAIESGDRAELRGELGDLLLQVVFQAQICEEAGCAIITVPHDILAKAAKMLGLDLAAVSLDTVKMFLKDSTDAGFKL